MQQNSVPGHKGRTTPTNEHSVYRDTWLAQSSPSFIKAKGGNLQVMFFIIDNKSIIIFLKYIVLLLLRWMFVTIFLGVLGMIARLGHY